MSPTVGAVLLSIAIAVLIVGALRKPKKTMFSGFLVKGSDGRIGITLFPVRKKGKRRRRR